MSFTKETDTKARDIKDSEYDVVIVGGGMVGASLACVLDKAGSTIPLKVLLVETLPIRALEKAAQPSFDSRSTVLSFGTRNYLSELGLWDKLAAVAEPIKSIHVSDQGKFGAARINSAEQQVDALGFVVENQVIGSVLNQALLEAKNVKVFSPARVLNIDPKVDSVNVTLEQKGEASLLESIVKTKLVVLAEGGRSGLCEKMGIYRSRTEYNQEAIITNVAFSKKHENMAYERFTSSGPLALLPLKDLDGFHRAALVWTQSSDEIEKVMMLNDKEFLAKLQAAFGFRLGEFNRVGERFSYPLSLELAEEQVRFGLVLLGNVAHSLHPVAGQGFNLAFRDTMRLAEAIIKALESNVSPGAIATLQSYLSRTVEDQDITIAFSHYMTALFSSENNALIWARKFGLLNIDLLPPLKKNLARQAMGQVSKAAQLNAYY
ncbi:2-octaprenyl-6-methoxyphenyl hydroxylase [Gammaproteobacteria bacterium]|nr:2-octaprenyl-6-methoxyphenyl hydroxylase [Gammaproteobacteria bacterium]